MFDQSEEVPLPSSPTSLEPVMDTSSNTIPSATSVSQFQESAKYSKECQKTYPNMLPLYEDAYKTMTLVGTVKIYKDASSNLHITSG
ncbi:unnamed protein product [Caenorhabditis nigoni]|uniref:Uncharacterized protein n=1 Tax=Caenorhabditis nigoni TaxID=1611254 RepID=A0A2G5SA47_9PELO|nr:hypothetical protein B9Z55_028850 [Caenorhabditis nigoni]